MHDDRADIYDRIVFNFMYRVIINPGRWSRYKYHTGVAISFDRAVESIDFSRQTVFGDRNQRRIGATRLRESFSAGFTTANSIQNWIRK